MDQVCSDLVGDQRGVPEIRSNKSDQDEATTGKNIVKMFRIEEQTI